MWSRLCCNYGFSYTKAPVKAFNNLEQLKKFNNAKLWQNSSINLMEKRSLVTVKTFGTRDFTYSNKFNYNSFGQLALLILGGIAFSTVTSYAEEKEKDKKPKLTYFNIKGRAEVARFILAETDTPYDYIGIDGTKLKELKEAGILAFNQVPFYEEGDLTLVQSHAINRHLARVKGLYGKNEKEASQIDQVYEGVVDLTAKAISIYLNNTLDDKKNSKNMEQFIILGFLYLRLF